MMNLRVKFKKGYEVKYVSHLDLMRTFQRMLKRTGYKIKYSEGFNPHMNLTFALPLPVGVTSDGEYAEFSIEENISVAEIKNRINELAPMGIEILEVTEKLTPKFKEIKRAEYTVLFETSNDISEFEKVVELSGILIEKKTKKGIKEIDIKPDIVSLKLSSGENGVCSLEMHLPCGNEKNIKPELVLAAMQKYQPDFKAECILPHRTAVYAKGKLIF